MNKGWMYILECANGAYYTGSTTDIELRLQQHQNGEGANSTKKHLPVKLVYFEEFNRIGEAFYREKQIQGWSRKKKEALINGFVEKLHGLAECKNETNYRYSKVASTTLSDQRHSPSNQTNRLSDQASSLSVVQGNVIEGKTIKSNSSDTNEL